MSTSPAFFILSTACDNLDDQQITERTAALTDRLNFFGYTMAPCRENSRGHTESAVLVIDAKPENRDCFHDVLRLARKYGQDSILMVDCNRSARRVYCDTRPAVELGLFANVSKREAVLAGDYTERDGRYYTCVAVNA